MRCFKFFCILCVSSTMLAREKEQLPQSSQSYRMQPQEKRFTPWYTGALLTSGAHTLSAGKYEIQPILFIRNTSATSNEHSRSKNTPNITTVQPAVTFQMGWLSWLDFAITMQCLYKHQSDKHAFHVGDTSLKWGVQLMKEEDNYPAIQIALTESIPTGKYEKLNPSKKGIDATGSGSYVTKFSFNIAKLFRFFPSHPLSCKASFNYAIPTSIHVRGFNAYGGGIGTKGWVKAGHLMAIYTAVELSLTQQWAFACDLAYTYQGRSTFSGNKGYAFTNQTASVGTPSNGSLSSALSIEYSQSDHLGFLAGIWFPIIKHNSPNFISYAFTMSYSW